MSGKATGIVWESDLPRPEKYVLLALADHAKDDGSDVYPSLWRIQWMTSYSETQVRDIMRRLMDLKILVKVHQGGRHDGDTNKYKIDYKAISALKDFKEWSAEKRAIEKRNKSAKVLTMDGKANANAGAETVPSNTETLPSGKGAVLSGEGYSLAANEGTAATAPKRTALERNYLEQDLGNEASSLPANPALIPGIEEQKQPAKAKPQDPRFPEICDAIRKSWPRGEGYKCDITPADAGAIGRMLATKHDWKAEELAVCVVARFMSASINPTESVKAWIGAVTDYQSGPQDKYGAPLYVGRALNDWRNQARVILYGPQPEQMQLAQAAKSADAVWEYARDFLKHRMSPANFETWIKPLKPAQMRDGVLFLSSPRSDAKEIFSMFGDLLEKAVDGRAVDVKLIQEMKHAHV